MRFPFKDGEPGREITKAGEYVFFAETRYSWLSTRARSPYLLSATGHLLETIPQQQHLQAIWLTPLLTRPELCTQIQPSHPRSLFIIGTEDPYYDALELTKLKKVTQGETLVIQGASHLLEIPDGVITSLHVMEQIMQTIRAFLDRKTGTS